MFQETTHLQPELSAGLGLFGAGFELSLRFHLLSAGFAIFECKFCSKGRKRERLRLSGNPLQALPVTHGSKSFSQCWGWGMEGCSWFGWVREGFMLEPREMIQVEFSVT